MSELKSVAAFFIGLVVFVIIIALAIGRLRPSEKSKVVILSPTPTKALQVRNNKDNPSLLDRIRGIFTRNTPTPTKSPTPTKGRNTPTPTKIESELKEAIRPTFVISEEEVNLNSQPVNDVIVIPETGASSLLLPLSLFLSGFGVWIKKKNS
jgi:hypothetical protein